MTEERMQKGDIGWYTEPSSGVDELVFVEAASYIGGQLSSIIVNPLSNIGKLIAVTKNDWADTKDTRFRYLGGNKAIRAAYTCVQRSFRTSPMGTTKWFLDALQPSSEPKLGDLVFVAGRKENTSFGDLGMLITDKEHPAILHGEPDTAFGMSVVYYFRTGIANYVSSSLMTVLMSDIDPSRRVAKALNRKADKVNGYKFPEKGRVGRPRKRVKV